MKDILRASVVNFKAEYGDKRQNLENIIAAMDMAKEEGAELVVLPELALTGYYIFDEDIDPKEKEFLCEEPDSKYMAEIKSAAKKLGIYTVYGFPERKADRFFNTAAFITPKGDISLYRKIHLFGKEGLFFSRGNKPLLIDTPWGKMSMGICYDTYNFPELLRYYAYKGARLYINPTAMALENTAEGARESFCKYYKTTMEYNAVNTGMFILSSNLTGFDKDMYFGGGSVIMGVNDEPKFKRPEVKYYAGDIYEENEGVYTATIDLSKHNPRLFVPSSITGDTDFVPELYAKLYSEK